MTEYGVTSSGFIPKPYSVILEELKQLAKQEFGEDIDLSENSRLLRFLEIVAKREDELWQLAEDAYYAGFIDFATGSSLDFLAALVGYKRIEARKATGTVTFSRSTPTTSDIIIPAGTRVATSDESVIFKTTEAVVLKAGDTSVDAPIEAVEPGSAGNVATNTITKIIDPISGIESVTNPEPTSGGRDAETDEEFRYRIKATIQSLGRATLDAIVARVKSVEGVKSVKIEENDTMNDYTAEGGLPPKSFRVFVWGGDDQAVAQAIFDAKPAGIQPYGSVSAIAYDIDGNPHTVYFERPTEVPIYIDVQVTTDGTDATEQEIKDAIKAYFDTLELGDDVIYNKVVAAVMRVPGVADATVKIGKTSPPAGTSNIAIADNEIAVTDDDKITVTIS
ncbi:baseplate J/gp47 family protein [Archaeoglobus profundus]|uniref:Baseplate J family protein n=1 Tax=Archaeoglobus profundus (strain DSM 5631 / JCM 9629 / NBRC 100127 / Av18) TaxID=572546 RepID=D2REI3_ARCPA|nr:baseplate J/gp47 family protein [Archaeoglobus profundus]ADB58527.1 Baseplate J family protein [Archaeoglobus profundus DSM 5631]